MSAGLYLLDRNGEPVRIDSADQTALLLWAQWFEKADRSVATFERSGVKVSTVFLGIDHNWGRGNPVLWETMIFGGKLDQAQWRYDSRAAAEAGHQRAVELVERSFLTGVDKDMLLQKGLNFLEKLDGWYGYPPRKKRK